MTPMMQRHKILAFLLALVVSIGLWVYAVTVVNPDDTTYIRDVRVRIVGTNELKSNNLMLTGGEDQTVNVEISGRRSNLKELNSTTLEAVADVSNIDSAGTYEVSWVLNPPSSVASGDVSLISANSNKITVQVSEYNERPAIPVSVEYTGQLPDGYVRDQAILNVETVAVSGPAEEVNKISKAIVTVDLSSATQTINDEMSYRLVDAEGVTLELSSYVTLASPAVRVSVPVSCYKQIDLVVDIIEGGGATEKNVKLTIDPPTIGVSGTAEALKDLDKLVIREVDLSQITGTQTWTVVPDLPVGVTNRASETSVTITLSLTGLMTKRITIPCTSIQRLNDVETLNFGEQSVIISVRGTPTELSRLKESDIKITADMTNDYDPATKSVTLKITLPAGTSAGVVGGPYTLQVIEVPAD